MRGLNTPGDRWVAATVGSNGVMAQLLIQVKAAGLTIVWSAVVSVVAL